MSERYRTFVREDGNRVIWLDQPDYRFPPHSHRRDEHDDDVFVIRLADMPRLTTELAALALAHRIGHLPNWADYAEAVARLLAHRSEAPDLDEGSAP